ncbi:HlyD family efflux transporter periplasmic adaptor subunit [Pantanalinema sp. GBBB05]|uniref:HlyD family efflux transporter periplasmic adaptor subunit n=1 Tax=Pantanalinema sp. GBBB05 TaxID=2604139 RepID=UPI001D5BC084|nr:HlyD family efflux transporter periplasmic adaptor subunit [Pantanalinema sp. GBBB05]
MPNATNSSNQFPHNGHHHHSADHDGHSGTTMLETDLEPRSPSSSPADVRDEWSSLTRETMDTMPRLWTRGLLYLLVVFAAIVLPWAMLSKVDEVGSARGQLEPKGKTYKLDAPVAGEVSDIKVKEGQTLKAGQVLVELESQLTTTDLQQAQAKLEGELNRLTQLQLMKTQLQGVTIQAQRQQGQAESAAQLAEVNEIQQRLSHGKTMRQLAQERLARELKEVERYQGLVNEGVVSEVQLVAVKRAVDDARRDLTQADSEVQQAEAQIQARQNQYQGAVRNQELTLLETNRQAREIESQMAAVQGDINQTKKQIEALKFQLKQRAIRSPIAGTLFQLPIDRPGAVVQPGQLVAQIAPEHVPLVLRATMSSRESGFLKVGMPVKLKFDAYPFQDYGIVEGRVAWIAPNSKSTETPQGNIQTFDIEVQLNQPYLQTGDKRIALTPGQTATAEVIVRQRRIIDFLLDPFKEVCKNKLNN